MTVPRRFRGSSVVSRLRWAAGLLIGAYAACSPVSLQSAVANGDTRTLNLVHAHTHETISATFLVNGQYDQAVLDKLNWFLRDWRRDEPTKMDPRLFDTVWEVYRESGSQQPIMVMSAYRSPETNAMLRRRSRQVAEHSQHILGRAMDQHYMDVPMSRIRELGMRLQRGGVGFYPTAGTPFVHLDVGGVRHWPRMSYDQLARLFPDGKTVHIPSNGQPLPGYEIARAELEARGDGSYPTASQLKTKGFFAWLFGGGGSDEDDDNAAAGVRKRESGTRVASAPPPVVSEYAPGGYGKGSNERALTGGVVFNLFGSESRQAAAASPARLPPPVAPVPAAPAPAVAPAMPATQPIPPTAVALALPPSPTEGNPATGTQPVIPDIPVASVPTLPMPPRRPVDLAALEPASPLPPSRPPELAALGRGTIAPHDTTGAPKNDAIGSLLASRASLPAVITGTDARSTRALGYAATPSPAGPVPSTVPVPVARPALLSTTLDRSNFRALTRPEPTSSTVGRSALGQAVPPLRAAVRADLGALAPRASTRGTFQSSASDLSADSFSGNVVRPATRSQPRTTVD